MRHSPKSVLTLHLENVEHTEDNHHFKALQENDDWEDGNLKPLNSINFTDIIIQSKIKKNTNKRLRGVDNTTLNKVSNKYGDNIDIDGKYQHLILQKNLSYRKIQKMQDLNSLSTRNSTKVMRNLQRQLLSLRWILSCKNCTNCLTTWSMQTMMSVMK